jgi:radical SAM protein with 4Fe4S-binding SPASM domain
MDLSYLIEFFLKNRLNREIFSILSKKDRQGKSILEDIFSVYTDSKFLKWGRKFELLPFYLFFELGRSVFGQTREEIKEKLSDPLFQHGIALTMRSVAQYGLRHPQIFSAPPVVVWNFTNACNLKCKHCYQEAGRKLKGELDLAARLDVVDQLADEDVFSIAFSGGEPLMDQHLWKVLERTYQRNLYASIATNGTLVTKEVAQKIADCRVNYVEISLDSTKPEVHDEFRGVPGFWEKAVRGIENAVAQEGFEVGVASTITQINIDELENLIQLAKNLGADKFYAFNFIPTGRGKKMADLDLTPQQREQMLNILYQHYMMGDIVCMTTSPQYARVCMTNSEEQLVPTSHYTAMKGKKAKTLAEFIGGCGVGRAYCSIQPDGIVTPCVFMPLPVGDLKKEKFIDIWNHSPILADIRVRDDLKGHCGQCEFRSACGGCRARAYAYFGDYKAPDPGCINNEEAFLQLKENLIMR